MKQKFNKEQLESLGLEAIKSFTDFGNTIVTDKEGAKSIQNMEETVRKGEFLKAFLDKLKKAEPKKPHRKHSSNYTPSPKRHRKAKTKY